MAGFTPSIVTDWLDKKEKQNEMKQLGNVAARLQSSHKMPVTKRPLAVLMVASKCQKITVNAIKFSIKHHMYYHRTF